MDVRQHLAPLVGGYAAFPAVQAITVVGSRSSGVATPRSDIDLFVYVDDTPHEEVMEMRAAVAGDLADPTRIKVIGQSGHPYADVWVLRGTDVLLDIMFWTQQWAEDELDWRLVKQSPQTGYSTCFWRSIRNGIPLFERDEWHGRLQERAHSGYPDLLRDRIIALNRDLLGRDNPFSFLHQAAKAAGEGDLVAVQHRVAAWLGSYFDVLFAANRVLHPGEKRLVAFAKAECRRVPEQFASDVERLVRLSGEGDADLVPLMDTMLGRLDTLRG